MNTINPNASMAENLMNQTNSEMRVTNNFNVPDKTMTNFLNSRNNQRRKYNLSMQFDMMRPGTTDNEFLMNPFLAARNENKTFIRKNHFCMTPPGEVVLDYTSQNVSTKYTGNQLSSIISESQNRMTK